MNVRYLEPRGTNNSSRVEPFMKLWDIPLSPAQQEKLKREGPVAQKRAETGNLNVEGTPYPSFSCLLTRFHPDFEAVVEPGVRQFLYAIAIDHDLVTYTSCEGHFYTEEGSIQDERHVGIIPRNPEERRRALAMFEEVAREFNGRFPSEPIEVAIMDHTVRDGEAVFPAIDLYLSKREGRNWNEYFAELERLSAELVSALLKRAGTPAPS